MGITHGHFKVCMAQDLLQCPEWSPAHDIVTRKGMPQIVRPEIGYPCPFDCCIEGSLNIGNVTILVTKDVFGPYRMTLPDLMDLKHSFRSSFIWIRLALSVLVFFRQINSPRISSHFKERISPFLMPVLVAINDKIPQIDSLWCLSELAFYCRWGLLRAFSSSLLIYFSLR